MAALKRNAAKEVHALEGAWQLRVNAATNAGTAAVLDERERQRAERQRLAAEAARAREEAAAAEQRAEALQYRFEQEQAACARLRESRCGAALERQKHLEEENKMLKQRRTGNQRRIRECNLDQRRAKESEKKAAALEQAFKASVVRAEARGSEAEAVDFLQKQVDDLQAKLKSETELREKYQEMLLLYDMIWYGMVWYDMHLI